MRFFLILFSFSILSFAALADMTQAHTAYDEGDFTSALELFLKEAEQGNSEAQFSVGVMYRNGQGIAKNYDESLKWLRISAAQKYRPAIYAIGLAYIHGLGMQKDPHEAMKYFQKGHDLQHARSSEALAMIYLYGQYNVKKDVVKAKTYLHQGLEFGNPASLLMLGMMYLDGEIYETDEYKGPLLIAKASTLGLKAAQEAIKEIEKEIGMPLKDYLKNTYNFTLPFKEITVCPTSAINKRKCTIYWNDPL